METMRNIEHVVVLMMENHSFDHLLGWLPGIGNLTGKEYNLEDPANPDSERFYVTKGASYTTCPDPAHDLADVNYQLFGNASPEPGDKAKNDGFVADFLRQNPPGSGRELMGCYTSRQLPVISTLAQQFTTLTRWFSAIPGPTGPNRLFTHCATSGGYAGNQYELEPGNNRIPTDLNTIYQHLMNEGKTWGIYWEDFSTAATQKQLRQHGENFHKLSTFFRDAHLSQLPNYSFLTPSLCPLPGGEAPTSQHPSYDIRPGENLMADVYEAIRNNPELWKKTVMIVCYDEHGGFYDSVPPMATVPNPDGLDYKVPPGFDFRRLGVRVPAIVISAYTDPGVDHTLYEHASIPATLKELFNLPRYLTARDEHSNSLLPLFGGSRTRTDAPTRLPRHELATTRLAAKPMDGIQSLLVKQLTTILESELGMDHELLKRAITDDITAGRFLRDATLKLLGKN